MYTVKVKGGLGNQLFCYAFGQYLESITSAKVQYDMTYYKSDTQQSHEKDYLSEIFPTLELAEPHSIPRFYPPRSSRFNNLGPKIFSNIPRIQSILKEKLNIVWESPYSPHSGSGPKNMHYYDFSELCESDLYFVGKWVCAKYAMQIKHTIVENLRTKSSEDLCHNKIATDIKNSESVSVHIRKTDNGRTSRIPTNWHINAIDEITGKLENVKIFLFSNDIDWAMSKIEDETLSIIIAENSGNSAVEVLELMSNCKHNIISASTFSWWAGFLNDNPNKMVYAPPFWQNVPDVTLTDLYPSTWIVKYE